MLSELSAGINRRWISFNIHIFASTMQCSNARILSNGCDLHRISQINELCVKYHPYPAPPCDVNTLVISRAHFQADRIKLATSKANAASHPHPQPQDSGFYFIFFSFFFFLQWLISLAEPKMGCQEQSSLDYLNSHFKGEQL